jgi:hypothetical protein
VLGGITSTSGLSFLAGLRGVETHIVARDLLIVVHLVRGRNYLNDDRFFYFEGLLVFKLEVSLLGGISRFNSQSLLRRRLTTTTHSSDGRVEIRAINLGFFNVRSALVR